MASDLGLYCLPMTLVGVSRSQWVEVALPVNVYIPSNNLIAISVKPSRPTVREADTKGDNLHHSSDAVKRAVSGHLDLDKLTILQY